MAASRIALLLLLSRLIAGSRDVQERGFSESKRCADPECSKLLCRGKAVADFTGPDCRFVNFKKDEVIYVYHKLTGRSSDLWAGSVGIGFGYFPKDLIDIKQVYTEDELELPTDGTDFVCFEDGADKFDSYDVEELLSKAKSREIKQPSPEAPASEAPPAEQSASDTDVKSKEPSSKSSEPQEVSPQSESEEAAKEAPPSGDGQVEPSPSETKEEPEGPTSSGSTKPSEEQPILEPRADGEEQPTSEFSIPQDKSSASDSQPTPEEQHSPPSERSTAHSRSEDDSPLGVSGPGTQPGEVFTSESDKPSEGPLGSDSGEKQENPQGYEIEKNERPTLIPESGKTSADQELIAPSEIPEKESESDQEKSDQEISEGPHDVHTITVNSKSKDSQEESAAHSATQNNAKSQPRVPDSEQAKNVSQGRAEELSEDKNVEPSTLVDKDGIATLKTEAGSAGDAAVAEDEEARRVKFEGEHQNQDYKPHHPQEVVGGPAEKPLFEDFDVKSSDPTAFENDSASSATSEAKTTPSKEEAKVSIDMGHATPIKQDKNILTTLGDTFFAIVSGGERTHDVTDLDGTDSEEEDDDEEPSEEFEDDNLYLLGMEKSNMREDKHLEPPFDDDLVVEEEIMQEAVVIADTDKSSETEQKVNISANNLPENAVNVSSADGELLPKSSTDTESVVDPGAQDQPEIGSELKTETVDSEIHEKTKEIQTPPNDGPLDGSESKETEIKTRGQNEVDYSDKPTPEHFQEDKAMKLEGVKEGISDQESLKLEDSNEELQLAEGSNLENLNGDQDRTPELQLDKSLSSTSEVPEDARSTSGSVTPEHPESSQIQPSDLVAEESGPPGAGGNTEERRKIEEPTLEKLTIVEEVPSQQDGTVDVETSLGTSKTNKQSRDEHPESSVHKEDQESRGSDGAESFKDGSIDSAINNQDLDEKTSPEVQSPSASVENDENLDGLLEDENAASARRVRDTPPNAEDGAKMDSDASAESQPNRELNSSEIESVDTTSQETEDSLEEEKDTAQSKEEETGKEIIEEPDLVTEDLTEKIKKSEKSGTKIEEENTETLEEEHVGDTSNEEDVQKEVSDQTHDVIADPDKSGPSAEDLDVDSTLPNNDLVEEESYIENIKALSTMREYLDEERIAQFTKHLGPDNIMRLEAMFQDMESEMKLARRDSLRLDHIDKALDQILEASESNILDFVESVLDSREAKHEEIVMEKEMFDEEAALLDDVQEISYKLRHKHSTLSDSSLLVPRGIQEEEDEKSSSLEVTPEEDKPERVTTEEPIDKEMVEQTPEAEDRISEEEKEEEEVVLPTQDPLDLIPREPEEAASQTDEDTGLDPTLEGEGVEEPEESEPWHASIQQIFSGMGSGLNAAKKSLSPAASLLMSALPEDLRPGPDCYGVQWEAIVVTALVGLISVVIFFWRTCLSVKRRAYQVSEKQLAEKIAALMKEKSEALEKISEFEKKIKEIKESESSTHEKSSKLQEEAASLKVTIKELRSNNKQLDARMRNLQQELDSQKSQNKRKQEMIYESQKSIERLKEQYEQHSAELSELQIALNEAKMKEQKVRSDFRSVQEENACLKERKEQLLKEAEGWSERQRELEEEIQLQQKSHKDIEEALAYKENEIEVLTNCIMQLKQLEEDSVSGEEGGWQPAGDGGLENGELPDNRKEKMKVQIKQMMDVSRVKTTLSIIEEEKDLYQRKLTDEVAARHELEEQIKQLQHDSSSLQSDKTRLDNECKTMRQKVEILTELYQQKEMALQKKLTQEEYERQEKEQKLSVADEKAILAIEEVKIYKQRIQEMEEELQKTERSFKNQIAGHEKKAHENWLVARTAERTLAEEKRECANLRQKLIEVNQRVATLQRPSIVKPTPGRPEHQPPPRRGALSRDGSFGPSPVSGGAPSPPIMMDVSVRSASANLSRSEDLKGNIGGPDTPSGTRRPHHDVSGRISAPVDLGHSLAGPRTSSPSVDGLPPPPVESEAPVMSDNSVRPEEPPAVMPVAKGPPSFPGTPVMNSPAGAPMMSQPPGRLIGPTPPRGHFSSRSLPPAQMHGPPPVPRDFPPRPLLPPGGFPPDPRGLMRGPLPPREYPPGPGPLHGPRDYPILPPGARDFPPGLPPPGPRDFPPGPRDFLPRDFPPGLPPPGAQEFPPGMRDFPPGPLPPGLRDIPPGLPPPGARDFPPVLPPHGSREFVPGLPPLGARTFLPGPPLGPREFLPGARDFPPGPPPMGGRDFIPGPHPGVPAGPSLPVPAGPSSQTDNEPVHHRP